jgi:hypothetical protein
MPNANPMPNNDPMPNAEKIELPTPTLTQPNSPKSAFGIPSFGIVWFMPNSAFRHLAFRRSPFRRLAFRHRAINSFEQMKFELVTVNILAFIILEFELDNFELFHFPSQVVPLCRVQSSSSFVTFQILLDNGRQTHA